MRETSPPPGSNSPAGVRLGVVVALPGEARAIAGRRRSEDVEGRRLIRQPLGGNSEVFCLQGGIGLSRAAHAAGKLAGLGVTALASAGLSGGIHPRLEAGQLLVAEQTRLGKRILSADPFWTERLCERLAAGGLDHRRGTLLCTERTVTSAAAKGRLFDETRALAVDRESAAVAGIAEEAGLPFFALRAVCDTAAFSFSFDPERLLGAAGQVRPGALVRLLLSRPAAVTELLVLWRASRRALSALRAGWQLLTADLAPEG